MTPPAPLAWSDSTDDMDWQELSDLYRAAPLGDKSPQWLATAFGNSMFRCFVRDGGRLVALARHLDRQRRGQAEVEDLGDDVRGLEVEVELGEARRQLAADPAHVVVGVVLAVRCDAVSCQQFSFS